MNKSRINKIKDNAIIADIAMDFLPELELPIMWDILGANYITGLNE